MPVGCVPGTRLQWQNILEKGGQGKGHSATKKRHNDAHIGIIVAVGTIDVTMDAARISCGLRPLQASGSMRGGWAGGAK